MLALSAAVSIAIVTACSSDDDSSTVAAAGGNSSGGQSGHEGGVGGNAGTSGSAGSGGTGMGGAAGQATGGGGMGGATPDAGPDAIADAQPDVTAEAASDAPLDSAAEASLEAAADTGPCTVEVVFEVDATGSQIPLNSYVTLTDPPPPGGTGVLHVAGNLQGLGQWTPNSVSMRDDGVYPDATAADGKWTFALTTSCGSDVQYKYTCGHGGDGWAGTEEYPLTNRGYKLPPNCSKVILRDVFADRPEPSGTLGPLTDTVETCP